MGKVKIAIKNNKEYCCKIVRRQIVDSREDYLEQFDYMNREFVSRSENASTAEMDDLRLIREIALTLILHHPYIVSLHEVYVTNYHYYLFMDV
jgi:serine/threonine protein kinase